MSSSLFLPEGPAGFDQLSSGLFIPDANFDPVESVVWTAGKHKPTFKPLDMRRLQTDDKDELIDLLFLDPDPRYFFLFCKIPTQHGSDAFDPFPWMEELSYRGITNREIMLKSREIGSSTFWVAVFLREMLADPGSSLLIVADKEENAVNLINYAKHVVGNLPPKIRPVLGRQNLTTVEFPRLESQIHALTATPDAGRSYRAKRTICTEMAFWKNAEEMFAAVMGSPVAGDKVVCESTANTPSDLFAEMWGDPTNGYRKLFFPWDSNPTHDAAWYRRKRGDIKNPNLFTREYPSNPQDAFARASESYFPIEVIAAGQAAVEEPIKTIPLRDDLGFVYIWRQPLHGAHYVIGVDASEGKTNDRGRPDWTSAVVLDWQSGEQVAQLYTRLPDVDVTTVLFELGKHYNLAHIAIEWNGPGSMILGRLHERGYPNLYKRRDQEMQLRGEYEETENLGWRTTGQTKPWGLGLLLDALRSFYLKMRFGLFWQEAKSFDRLTMQAAKSAHDDNVMAAMIAWVARQQYQPVSVAKPRYEIQEPASSRRGSYGSWRGMWGKRSP